MKNDSIFDSGTPPWICVPQHSRQYAFTDESGNFGFDFKKQGVSSHFVITAIIVDEGIVTQLEEQVETIRKKNFQINRTNVYNANLDRIHIRPSNGKMNSPCITAIRKIHQMKTLTIIEEE